MKINKLILPLIISVIGFISFIPMAFASTPTLSASLTGSGDSVTMTVNGDANATVLMYYTKTGVGPTLNPIGSTNSSGYLSVSISSATLSIASGSAVHVIINGQSSADVAWPYTSSTTTSTITLSQTGLVLNVNGSSTVTASGSSSLYLLNNSNASIANVSISGNSITVTGNAYGSTVVTICPQGSSTGCPSIYVTVQSSGSSALTFSQSNITIANGQSIPVTISGGTGVYTVLNNSNPSYVSASLSSSTVTLTALQSSGYAAITICSSNISSCGIINVTIGSASTATLYFSQTNPTVSTGSNLTIGLSGGGSSTYYLSSNSNTNVVQATVSGTNLNLYGILSGTSTVTVCSSLGSCNSLPVTVSYVSTGGSITLSQTSVSLLVGQSLSVTVSGGATPYNLSSNSGSYFQSSISGNIITLYGINPGTSTVLVCSSEGSCVTLSVTVNSSSTTTNNPVLSQSSISLSAGQSQSVTVSGNGGYYISGNTNSSIASATINGNTITVSGITSGSTNISVCQNGGLCSILYVSVTSSSSTNLPTTFLSFGNSIPFLSVGQSTVINISGGTSGNYYIAYNSSSSVAQTSINGSALTVSGIARGCAVLVVCSSSNVCGPVLATVGLINTGTNNNNSGNKYKFVILLAIGDSNSDVSELQERLKAEGYYTGSITGYYGNLTAAAVRSYQKAKGISQTGTLGPLTRAALNQ